MSDCRLENKAQAAEAQGTKIPQAGAWYFGRGSEPLSDTQNGLYWHFCIVHFLCGDAAYPHRNVLPWAQFTMVHNAPEPLWCQPYTAVHLILSINQFPGKRTSLLYGISDICWTTPLEQSSHMSIWFVLVYLLLENLNAFNCLRHQRLVTVAFTHWVSIFLLTYLYYASCLTPVRKVTAV